MSPGDILHAAASFEKEKSAANLHLHPRLVVAATFRGAAKSRRHCGAQGAFFQNNMFDAEKNLERERTVLLWGPRDIFLYFFFLYFFCFY